MSTCLMFPKDANKLSQGILKSLYLRHIDNNEILRIIIPVDSVINIYLYKLRADSTCKT